MGRMSDLHIMIQEQEPCYVVGDDKGVWIKDSQGHVINMHPYASMAEARRFCLGIGLNLQVQQKGENMPEKPAAPRFLIEIKQKKEVIYKVELGLPNKEIAQEWGNKWKVKNHRGDDHKVVVTEILVQPQTNEGLKLEKDAEVVANRQTVIKAKK
jgi:hypothetical protein